MNKEIAVLVVTLGLFALAAIIIRPGISAWLPSSLLLVCGILAFTLSPVLAKAESQLAQKNTWLNLEAEPRPFKYRLWGIGVIIVGLAWLFLGA